MTGITMRLRDRHGFTWENVKKWWQGYALLMVFFSIGWHFILEIIPIIGAFLAFIS